eukprot:m51a1_g1092 hypothetical protein (77) ;mRNA; f:65715-65945
MFATRRVGDGETQSLMGAKSPRQQQQQQRATYAAPREEAEAEGSEYAAEYEPPKSPKSWSADLRRIVLNFRTSQGI